MKKSKLTSYFSKEEEAILEKTAGIVILMAILAVPFIMIARTPLGKALMNLLGGLAGLIGGLGSQLKTCNKVGYFNVSEGCWMGIAAIIGSIFYVLGKFVYPFVMKDGPAKDLVKSASAASGESEVNITIEIVNQVQADIDLSDQFENMSPEAKDVFIKKCFARRAYARGVEARKSQANSPEAKKADAEARTAAAEAETEATQEATEELTPEQEKMIDDALDGIDPVPPPVEPV
jgi:hypothetical protein